MRRWNPNVIEIAYSIASWSAGLGDREKALHYLRGAIERGCDGSRASDDPGFASLHDDAAFIALISGAEESADTE